MKNPGWIHRDPYFVVYWNPYNRNTYFMGIQVFQRDPYKYTGWVIGVLILWFIAIIPT